MKRGPHGGQARPGEVVLFFETHATSYEQVTRRVGECLAGIGRDHAGKTVLIVGHRATFFALEHLLHGVPLGDAVAAPWEWQPGWDYRIPSGFRP